MSKLPEMVECLVQINGKKTCECSKLVNFNYSQRDELSDMYRGLFSQKIVEKEGYCFFRGQNGTKLSFTTNLLVLKREFIKSKKYKNEVIINSEHSVVITSNKYGTLNIVPYFLIDVRNMYVKYWTYQQNNQKYFIIYKWTKTTTIDEDLIKYFESKKLNDDELIKLFEPKVRKNNPLKNVVIQEVNEVLEEPIESIELTEQIEYIPIEQIPIEQIPTIPIENKIIKYITPFKQQKIVKYKPSITSKLVFHIQYNQKIVDIIINTYRTNYKFGDVIDNTIRIDIIKDIHLDRNGFVFSLHFNVLIDHIEYHCYIKNDVIYSMTKLVDVLM